MQTNTKLLFARKQSVKQFSILRKNAIHKSFSWLFYGDLTFVLDHDLEGHLEVKITFSNGNPHFLHSDMTYNQFKILKSRSFQGKKSKYGRVQGNSKGKKKIKDMNIFLVIQYSDLGFEFDYNLEGHFRNKKI